MEGAVARCKLQLGIDLAAPRQDVGHLADLPVGGAIVNSYSHFGGDADRYHLYI